MAESKPSISVCTISGAEAGRIGRALASVQDWTLERIVVLNEEVRDGTEEIALKHGARVYREPWKGYIAQKNSAADKATANGCLIWTPDEAVSPSCETRSLKPFPTPRQPEVVRHSVSPAFLVLRGAGIRHGDWYPGPDDPIVAPGQRAVGVVSILTQSSVLTDRSASCAATCTFQPGID
jgi:glycosyltransferase involved in cell wall biosynthesis